MTKTVEMPLGMSIVLYDIIGQILNEEKEVDGKKISIPRNLPLKLSYKLNRCRNILERDYKQFEEKRVFYIGKYGKTSEDGSVFEVAPEYKEAYESSIDALLETEVSHSINKLEPADFEALTNDVKISMPESLMKLLLAYLVEDEDYIKDIGAPINFKTYVSPITQTEAPVTQTETKVEKKKPSKRKKK